VILNTYVEKHRQAMANFVTKSENPMKTWLPSDSTDSKLSDHASNLEIPCIFEGKPSLLLHELGESLEPKTASHVSRVFSGKGHSYVALRLIWEK
jgi:hypothetical protein